MAAKPETKDIKAEEQKPKVPSPSALPNGLGFGEAFRVNLENSDPRANPEPIPAPLPCANSNPGTDQNLNATRAPTRTFNPTPDPARPEPEATPLPGSDNLIASLVLAAAVPHRSP